MTIEERKAKAIKYAAEAKERNKPPHDCPVCRNVEQLERIQLILAGWK